MILGAGSFCSGSFLGGGVLIGPILCRQFRVLHQVTRVLHLVLLVCQVSQTGDCGHMDCAVY